MNSFRENVLFESDDVIITLWAVKSYAHPIRRCMGPKIKVYTPEKLKVMRNEPILQTVTGLQKMTQLQCFDCQCDGLAAYLANLQLKTSVSFIQK